MYKIERDERRSSTQITELLATHLQIPETEQEDFIRRVRGEFVARLVSCSPVTIKKIEQRCEVGNGRILL